MSRPTHRPGSRAIKSNHASRSGAAKSNKGLTRALRGTLSRRLWAAHIFSKDLCKGKMLGLRNHTFRIACTRHNRRSNHIATRRLLEPSTSKSNMTSSDTKREEGCRQSFLVGLGMGGSVSFCWLIFLWWRQHTHTQGHYFPCQMDLVRLAFSLLLDILICLLTPKTTGTLGTVVGILALPAAAQKWAGVSLPPIGPTFVSAGFVVVLAAEYKRIKSMRELLSETATCPITQSSATEPLLIV